MSLDNVKAFYGKLENDEALREKVNALSQRENLSGVEITEELVRIAADIGFLFSLDELVEANKEYAKGLSDDDLQALTASMNTERISCPEPPYSCEDCSQGSSVPFNYGR